MMILQLRKTTVPERLPSPSAARLSGHCGP